MQASRGEGHMTKNVCGLKKPEKRCNKHADNILLSGRRLASLPQCNLGLSGGDGSKDMSRILDKVSLSLVQEGKLARGRGGRELHYTENNFFLFYFLKDLA